MFSNRVMKVPNCFPASVTSKCGRANAYICLLGLILPNPLTTSRSNDGQKAIILHDLVEVKTPLKQRKNMRLSGDLLVIGWFI